MTYGTSVRHCHGKTGRHGAKDPHAKLSRDEWVPPTYPTTVTSYLDTARQGPRRALTATPAGRTAMLYG